MFTKNMMMGAVLSGLLLTAAGTALATTDAMDLKFAKGCRTGRHL